MNRKSAAGAGASRFYIGSGQRFESVILHHALRFLKGIGYNAKAPLGVGAKFFDILEEVN